MPHNTSCKVEQKCYVNLTRSGYKKFLHHVSNVESEDTHMESIEQELMIMLKQLPEPIIITWQSNRYHWQCLDGHGSSNDLVEATRQGLNYMIASFEVEDGKFAEIRSKSKA